jgi:hypothetical protein
MRRRGQAPLAAALAAAIALGGCAAARTVPTGPCESAFQHADGVLRQALATYVREMKRFAATRDPGVSTARAEERVSSRADAWSDAHRRDVVSACGAWPEDQLRCVASAQSPQSLTACGLGELVSSFTDEVLASFAAQPLDPAAPPSR